MGQKEYDVRFYTPLNEYGLIVTYDTDFTAVSCIS